MARRESNKRNELKINDNISGSIITLYFRMPTPSERQGYSNMAVQRQGRKIKFLQSEARLKYGMAIISGFGDGDFERTVDGAYLPMSCEPGSDGYFEGWRDWVQENADDLVMLLAAHVYDSPAEIADDDENENEDITENSPGT